MIRSETARLEPSMTRVCDPSEIPDEGFLVRAVGGRNVALFRHDGVVRAVDNRCPHMGFPLSKGVVRDGLLVCPWHHARFDVCSGGTFDQFADDLPVFAVEEREDGIWVDPHPAGDRMEYAKARLRDGAEQDIGLVSAKAVLTLMERSGNADAILTIAGRFGVEQRGAGWRDGLTILTAMGNLLPDLRPDDRPLALYHGLLHVAGNVRGQRPHFLLDPLPTPDDDGAEGVQRERLRAWLRRFAHVRDRDGVERVILTAIDMGLDDSAVADMLLAALTDHSFLDNGHSIDFVNKAFELLDRIGWEHAPAVLPSIVPSLTNVQRMEETNAWRAPVDLVEILEPHFERLLAGELTRAAGGSGPDDSDFDALVQTLLGDDPTASAQALADGLSGGAALPELGEALCCAALERVARFHTSNEFVDWIAVLHTLSSAHATLRLLQRAPSLEGARGLWHAAMHLYLNRLFNTPSAKLPTTDSTADLPEDGGALIAMLLQLTEQRAKVEEAAAVTYRYLDLGLDPAPLIGTLGQMLLREDGEFHSYQMLEAGVRLFNDLRARRPKHASVALVAVARYLAAHAPTDRATTQTWRIARRLHAGEAVDGEMG